jgi:hypothetical protein
MNHKQSSGNLLSDFVKGALPVEDTLPNINKPSKTSHSVKHKYDTSEIYTKKHNTTKNNFFLGKKKKNIGILNLDIELQDKKIMNKLLLIQKHNEGV